MYSISPGYIDVHVHNITWFIYMYSISHGLYTCTSYHLVLYTCTVYNLVYIHGQKCL